MSVIDNIIKENKLKEVDNKEIKEYDDRGNLIHYRDSDGFEYWQEYNENGKVTHYKDSDDFERWYEYDANGKVTHFKDFDGFEYWKEYDTNGKVTKELILKNGKYYLNGKELEKEGLE